MRVGRRRNGGVGNPRSRMTHQFRSSVYPYHFQTHIELDLYCLLCIPTYDDGKPTPLHRSHRLMSLKFEITRAQSLKQMSLTDQ